MKGKTCKNKHYHFWHLATLNQPVDEKNIYKIYINIETTL
jgi:hypothetical protein